MALSAVRLVINTPHHRLIRLSIRLVCLFALSVFSFVSLSNRVPVFLYVPASLPPPVPCWVSIQEPLPFRWILAIGGGLLGCKLT